MLTWPQSTELTAALAVAGLAFRCTRPAWTRVAAAFAFEASLIAALYSVWQFVGNRTVSDEPTAIRHAQWVDRFEHTLHFPSELSAQRIVLGHPALVQGANLYYDTMHFAMIFVFLLWLFVRHRDRYAQVRTVLAISTLVCLVISFVPVAPPRILAGSGFVDTAVLYGQSVYASNAANELSAMPSVHVLWAVLIAWYGVRIGRGRWRALGPVHAAVTTFVVACTANHWWLDGVVAVVVLAACAGAQVGVVAVWAAWRMRGRAIGVVVPEAARPNPGVPVPGAAVPGAAVARVSVPGVSVPGLSVAAVADEAGMPVPAQQEA
jgi:PAP2 superfamily